MSSCESKTSYGGMTTATMFKSIKILLHFIWRVVFCQAHYCVPVIHPKAGLKTFLSIASWYQSHQETCRVIKPGWNNVSVTQRKDKARSNSVVWVGPPQPTCISQQPLSIARQFANTQLLSAAMGGPSPLLAKRRHNSGVCQVPCNPLTSSKDKRAFIDSATG